MSREILTLLFHGPSGSGKDTQARLLQQKYGTFEIIGTGDMMRTFYKEGNPIAVRAKENIDKGLFSSDEEIYSLFDLWLKRFDSAKHWILVSAVRRASQIPLLDDALQNNKKELDGFIHFKLSLDDAIERLSNRWICTKCGKIYHPKFSAEKKKGFCDVDGARLVKRDDDNPDAIKERMRQYSLDIEKIKKIYQKRGIFYEIDASKQIEQVFEQIVKVINEILSKRGGQKLV